MAGELGAKGDAMRVMVATKTDLDNEAVPRSTGLQRAEDSGLFFFHLSAETGDYCDDVKE